MLLLTQLINKRRIAAIRAQPDGVADATEALAEFVDHFPLDQESWQELASLYTEQNKYAQAAYALEELLLLAPHNSYYLLQYAETLYTMGEIAKAYKIYLRVLELGEGNMKPKSGRASDRVSGPWVRTLWGLKVVRIETDAVHGAAACAFGQADLDRRRGDRRKGPGNRHAGHPALARECLRARCAGRCACGSACRGAEKCRRA